MSDTAGRLELYAGSGDLPGSAETTMREAKSRIEELEKENNNLEGRRCDLNVLCLDLKATNDRLEGEVKLARWGHRETMVECGEELKTLREALKKYAKHNKGCRKGQVKDYRFGQLKTFVCRCGLDQAFSGQEEAK